MLRKALHSERFHRLSKEGFWVIFGQAMAVIGSLVGVRVFTGLLDPKAYGELVLGMTAAILVNQVVFGPLSSGITRFYAPASEKGDVTGYLKAVRRMVLSATGVVMLMFLIIAVCMLINGRTEWIAIVAAAFIFAIFSGYNAILSCVQNAARQRVVVAFHQGMDPWARFLIAAGLMILVSATSTVAMAGCAIAAMPVLISQYVFFQKKILPGKADDRKRIDWAKQIWVYFWPVSVFGGFTWLQVGSDRWALQFFATTSEVGRYAALLQLGFLPVSMAAGAMTQFLSPIFYQRAGDASDSKRNMEVNKLGWRLVWIIFGLTGVGFLIALLFHSQVFWLFAAKEYASVSHFLPWMLLAGGIFAAGQAKAINLESQMKMRLMMMIKIITAILGVGFNFAGAYFFGIKGIVIAGVLFSALYFSCMAVFSKE